MQTILLVSTSYNEHAHYIEQGLRARQAEVVRFDADSAHEALSLADDRTGSVIEGVALDRIASVFVHHPIVDVPEEFPSDEQAEALYRATWSAALRHIEALLPDRVWINGIAAAERAASLPLQRQVARRYGMRVPRMIVTNRMSDVVAFAAGLGTGVILKPGNLRGLRMRGKRMLATLIEPGEIDEAVLARSPCLFQEYIEKAYEVRVHVIGSDVFACRIDSQSSEKTRVDWRNYDIRNTPHYALRLDDEIETICRTIVRSLGLTLGILDLIVTPDGEVVFLECNAQGHWLWIEELTALPITDRICTALLSGD